eukprot:CAMPEP_0201120468 /NCGR_PEP_ID=MMETSP0850-20130426/4527_1 /ASSEMBLY_ACC=CAM_ASM_000622 /TAXON_ID=183588 /ORGANISM="Pseudo-nitzschia fraudulenta, Strain WWA7" /LENGTH=349 /DNA_ID=CAMNT_0047386621 /DNA_START=107 /DNA_END=1156 /DNA_ORIENTATION=+
MDNEKKSIWSDVPRRLFTICIGVPLVWKLLERPFSAYVFFFGAHALSAWEFTLLEPSIATTGDNDHQKQQQQLSRQTRFLFCGTSLALSAIPDSFPSLFSFTSSLAAAIFAVTNRHHWIVGLLFVTLPFRAWCNLAYPYYGGNSSDPLSSSFASTVAVLLTVWNADTGALIAGRLLGRKKNKARTTIGGEDTSNVPLWIRRISPAKTMEGFLGGIVGGVGTAAWGIPLLLNAFSIETSTGFRKLWGLDDGSNGDRSIDYDNCWNRFVLGFCLSVLGILGDLTESSIKRRSRSKDSGSVLPGHGGILDRFDSSLLAVLFYRIVLEQATAMAFRNNDGNMYSNLPEGNSEL